MPDKYHVLRGVLIISLLAAILAGKMDSVESTLNEQTLLAIEDCMARSPGEWPDEWRLEIEPARRPWNGIAKRPAA